MAIRTHAPKKMTKPPKTLITPDGKVKFPAGHAVFMGQEINDIGEKSDLKMTVVFMGQTYNERGQWLSKDPKKLKAGGYTVNQNMLNELRKGVPQAVLRTCVSETCSYDELPLQASFCSVCGAPQPAKIIDPYTDDLGALLQYMDPADPFACLQPQQDAPERVTAEQLMPTAADMQDFARKSKIPATAEAVPGEGARRTATSAKVEVGHQVTCLSERK